ncbi:hypothetical protein HDV57DRAFT_240023 [Trichoderma longibrachiatum]
MSIGSCWVASEPDILCRHACLGGRLYCGHILRLTLFRPLRFGIRKMRSQALYRWLLLDARRRGVKQRIYSGGLTSWLLQLWAIHGRVRLCSQARSSLSRISSNLHSICRCRISRVRLCSKTAVILTLACSSARDLCTCSPPLLSSSSSTIFEVNTAQTTDAIILHIRHSFSCCRRMIGRQGS